MTFLFLCFFTNTATTEIYTLSLHDALPIIRGDLLGHRRVDPLARRESRLSPAVPGGRGDRDGAVLAALPVRPLGPGVRLPPHPGGRAASDPGQPACGGIPDRYRDTDVALRRDRIVRFRPSDRGARFHVVRGRVCDQRYPEQFPL